MNEQEQQAEVHRLVDLWKPRLGIAERVMIEFFPEDDPDARCAMIPARMIPEADKGLWDFVLEWSLQSEEEDLRHQVVHELVHLLLEPLRMRLFFGMSLDSVSKSPRQHQLEEQFETVVQRIADACERAWMLADYPLFMVDERGKMSVVDENKR